MTGTESDEHGNLSRHDARFLHLVHVEAVAAVLFDPVATLAFLDVPDAELGRLLKTRIMEVVGMSTALNIDLRAIHGPSPEEANCAKLAPDLRMGERRSLVDDGKLLRTSRYCAASGISERKLSRAVSAGRIFSVDIEGEPCYPAFFLVRDLDRKDLAKVVRRLDGLTGWSKWEFLTSPNMSLGNMTPLQALMHREVKQVLSAARAFKEGSILATVTAKAIGVLGSKEAAKHWLATPAIALDRCRPLDLLHDPNGVESVMTLLVRIDHGVYT
ncbi:antitoxin Xre/MbcA/ParS toxin-binding domain-containing protein [Paraburkholderia sp. BR10954]|uniref:antitoxin Xre/MbcA/ParS toxin-binding domain-containing protein n=1 Tax=Paraburkholderia sp. BR10954 TaxID=3236995 RepID=UPI0034D2B36D